MSLFERIRPHCEAAPWVCEEVKKLERENAALRKALEDDRREWRKLALCLGVGQPVIVLGSAAIDLARSKEGGAT